MKPILTCQRGSTRVKLLTMCLLTSSPHRAHTFLIPLQREPSSLNRSLKSANRLVSHARTCILLTATFCLVFPGLGVVWRADRWRDLPRVI